jgi:hypothetical protein
MSKLDKKYTRNFALGTIYFSAKCRDSDLRSPRIQCTRYFARYRRKNACFPDIKAYVAALPKEEQSAFLHDIALISDDEVRLF